MTRPGPRRPPAPLIALLLALNLWPGLAAAQEADCPALRAEIDAAAPDADPSRLDAAMRQRRDEIVRARDDADRTGCGDGVLDDADAPPCRALARRIEMLEIGLQRLQAQSARGDSSGDGRRRALQAEFDARCSADRAEAGDGPATLVPVDPDTPPGPAAKPRATRVLCVRRCDGAFYPLAADVPPDRMPDMDRICQAQCPAAEASAYAGGEDVASATATDGSAYSALPTAFAYLKGVDKACACRAPRQSWAAALAGAEVLLEPHRGDVTVTAELAAAMARPVPSSRKAAPAAARAAPPPKAGRAKPAPALAPPPPAPVPDLTREFRGSDPTL